MKIIKKIIFQKKKPIADNVKMNLAYLSVKFYALKVEMSGLRVETLENKFSNRILFLTQDDYEFQSKVKN